MSVLPPINDLTDDECGDNASKKNQCQRQNLRYPTKPNRPRARQSLRRNQQSLQRKPQSLLLLRRRSQLLVFIVCSTVFPKLKFCLFTCVPGILCGHTNEEACGEREGRHQDQQPAVPQGLQRMDLEEWLQASDCRALLVFVFSTSDKYLLCV